MKQIMLVVLLGVLGVAGFFMYPRSQTPSSPSPSVTPTPTSQPSLSKKSYVIAMYGDSMIDTMADYPELLQDELKRKYPGTTFTIYNYGVGAQNIRDGAARWESSFSNRGREYKSIVSVDPDVIIVGSFAYNPFSPHDPAEHKRFLTQIVEKAKKTGASVYMLAEMAPGGAAFGDGETKGINWQDQQSIEHSDKIIEQIENAFAVAKEQGVPIIDVFNRSKATGSKYAQREYINEDDGIHYSFSGQSLTAESIATALTVK